MQDIITTFVGQSNQRLQLNIQQRMNSKYRMLPHLNSYFLQRKAYEQHRKKIDQIKRSRSRSKIKIKTQIREISNDNNESRGPIRYQIHTINEQINEEYKYKLSPKAKRDQYQIRRENNRLLKRIQQSKSTINRKQIERHQLQIQKRKQRLSRFVYSPLSNKVLLKCKQSLQILRMRQAQKQQNSYSFSHKVSRVKYAKTEISHLQTHGSSERLNESNSISKKSSFDKFYLLKNSSKIKQHFDNSDFHRLANSNFEALKNGFWNISRKRIRTQVKQANKLFATEIQD